MPKNNTHTNEDASNPDSPSDVLDISGAGAPHVLPPSMSARPDAPPRSAPPPTGEFMVEVELAPGVEENIDALLSGINAPGSTEGGEGAVEESDVARVARSYGLIEARPVFTREVVERDNARINTLRDATGGPAESASQRLNELDQLPPLSRFVRLRFPPGATVDALITELNALPQVKRAAVVPRAAPPSFPMDPMIGANGSSLTKDANGFEPQWYLHRTRVKEAWQIALGAGVVIADVDWGCMTTHRELAPAIKLTYNAVDGSDDVIHGPERAHGTGVLGLAGARADGQGLAGYAPKSDLWAIKGDSPVNPQFEEPWVEAIDFVSRTSAGSRRKVIIVEVQTDFFGNYEQVPSFNRAIKAAIANGCVVCVAAGNGDRRADRDDFGDSFDPTGSILVGATRFHDTLNVRIYFSNYGPTVDVSAPGDGEHDVTCGEFANNGEVVNNAYRNAFGGTSGAAAKVAGAVALILSANPNLSHSEVRDILKTTGSPVITETDKPIGVFLNTEAAVLEARRRLEEP